MRKTIKKPHIIYLVEMNLLCSYITFLRILWHVFNPVTLIVWERKLTWNVLYSTYSLIFIRYIQMLVINTFELLLLPIRVCVSCSILAEAHIMRIAGDNKRQRRISFLSKDWIAPINTLSNMAQDWETLISRYWCTAMHTYLLE